MISATSHHGSYIASASWLISPDASPIAGGALLIRNGRIAGVGSLEELRRNHVALVVDYPGCAIVPGFVNAHTHLELTHFPSWRMRNHGERQPRSFVDWLIRLIKIRRSLRPGDISASAREGIRMCLGSGTTAVGEIVTSRQLLALYASSSLSGRMFIELLGHEPVRLSSSLNEAVHIARDSGHGAFSMGLSPHSTYTIAEKNLHLIKEALFSARLPISIHCSESQEETDFIFDTSGELAEKFYPFVGWEQYLAPPRRCSSTELLDRVGLLTADTTAVHCVRITRADAGLLKKRCVKVVLCPRSNEFLDVGKAPVALLRKMGIPLALGTDSLASNDSLSLWDEIRFALQVFQGDLTPSELFRMATLGGAEALGIERSHGSLEKGKRADFQIVGCIGAGERKLLERVLLRGVVEDVYVAGTRFVQESD